jgi:uncharacterized protein YbjT (DUF2867 family)
MHRPTVIAISAGTGRVATAIARELEPLPGSKRFVPATASRGVLAPGFTLFSGGTATAAARARALKDVRHLVLLPAFDPRAAEAQSALVRDAAQAGVEHVHHVSLVGGDARSPVCLLRWVGLVERELTASPLPHTILRCTPFMQNFCFFTRRDDAGLAVIGPFRDVAFPWLDAGDVGAILANAIRRGDGGNFECQLSGPEALDFATLARLLSEAVHEPVRYADVCLPETQGVLEARGFSPVQIRAATEYWDYLVSGVIKPSCCNSALELLGRPPRTLAEYFAAHADELRAAA